MIKQKTVISLATVVAAGGLLLSVGQTQAFIGQSGDGLFAKLASRFGKSEAEVTQVIEEFRQEKRSQVMQGFEGRLERAVANGELTTQQMQLILEKRAEFQAGCDSTGEKKQLHHEELTAWADENGIDSSFLMGRGLGNGTSQRLGEKGQGRGMLDKIGNKIR